jgi:chromosome segregation ATPase
VSWIEQTLYQALRSLQHSFSEIQHRLQAVEQATTSSGFLEQELIEVKERQKDILVQLKQLTIQIRHLEACQMTLEKEQELMLKELKGALRSLGKFAEASKIGSP